MKLLNVVLAVAVLVTASTVTVASADSAPRRWRTVRVCNVVVRHHHRTRVCRMVRRPWR